MPTINISIDDVSPHPLSSRKVVDVACRQILDEFPNAKFTLFVPVAYFRTIPAPPQSAGGPYWLSKHPEFCDFLRDLDPDRFEIGYHGFHHGVINSSNNDELKTSDEENLVEVFDAMFDEVLRAGLDQTFSPLLRPPGWKLSSQAARS